MCVCVCVCVCVCMGGGGGRQSLYFAFNTSLWCFSLAHVYSFALFFSAMRVGLGYSSWKGLGLGVGVAFSAQNS